MQAKGTQWGNLIAAIATVASCDIAMGLTLQLVPLLLEEQGVSARMIGLNAALGPIGILLIGAFFPVIVGRSGPRAVTLGAVCGIVACLAAFKLLPSLPAWFVIRLAFGAFAGMLFTTSEALILTFAGEKSRGPIMGLYTSVLAVAFAVGPLTLPWSGIQGWLPWVIGMICIGLGALPLLFVNTSHIDFKPKESWALLRFIKRAPLLLLAVVTVTLFDNVFISFFTIFGMRSGVPLTTGSLILGTAIVCNILVFTPMGWIADRWSRTGVMMISSALTVSLSLGLIIAVQGWALWPVAILLSASAFGPYIIALATLGDRFSGADLIAGSAAFSAMWGIGGLVGPPVAGAAIDAFGINAMPVTIAVFHGGLFLLLLASRGVLVRQPSHA